MISKQEERIDTELAKLDVKAHITHLKQPAEAYYKVITVATPQKEAYRPLEIAVSVCYLKAHVERRSDLGTFLIDGFNRFGAGVALCHYRDNFNRARGRIIAKGRLLKIIKGGNK